MIKIYFQLSLILWILISCTSNQETKNYRSPEKINTLKNPDKDSLYNQLNQIIKNIKGVVGISAIQNDFHDTIFIHENQSFPMQSICKFPLAIYILKQIDEGKMSFNQTIPLYASDMRPYTWSPLRDRYPRGSTQVTLYEILKETIRLSDNIGCDILYRLIGGPKVIQTMMIELGINDYYNIHTIAEIQSAWNIQFKNTCTPKGIIQLMTLAESSSVISKRCYDTLYKFMYQTPTGEFRIPSLLPKETPVAHKTGTSGTYLGITAATNDIGFVQLPGGKKYSIAIFLMNSNLQEKQRDLILAKISKLIYDYYMKYDKL